MYAIQVERSRFGTSELGRFEARDGRPLLILSLGGVSENQQLQAALKALSTAKGDANFDPRKTDGASPIGGGTIAATINAALALGSSLPGAGELIGLVNDIKSIPILGTTIIRSLLNPVLAQAYVPQLRSLPSIGGDVADAVDDVRALIERYAGQIASAITMLTPGVPGDAGGDAGGDVSAGAAYPAGSVGRFKARENMWYIYSPAAPPPIVLDPNTTVSVHQTFRTVGAGLGAPPPAGYIRAGMEKTLPPGVRNAGDEPDPVYERWWFWPSLGGGLLVVGGSIWYASK
jgi:hypothetical protein